MKIELNNEYQPSNDQSPNNNTKYNLEERLLEYSMQILRSIPELPKSRECYHIANQLLRSGTSVYPNHAEAQAAESSADFIHKIRISLKELRETKCWLRLIKGLGINQEGYGINILLQETEELIKIFASSIKTAKYNRLKM